MAQTIVQPTGRGLIAPRPERRLGHEPKGRAPGQAAPVGFSPPEAHPRPEARPGRLKRRGGVERIDRILAELLALYGIDPETDPAACANSGAMEPADV